MVQTDDDRLLPLNPEPKVGNTGRGDAQPASTQPKDAWPDDTWPEGAKPSDVRLEGTRPESTQPEDTRPGTTRQRILHAAARVFAEQGYARATTRALAAAADVNEVTLFRHFGSKQKLFAAVTEQFAGPAVTAALEAQLTGDFRQDLVLLGSGIMKVLLERQHVLRLMLCEAAHFPEVRQVMAQNPRQLRQLLARYLQRQMEMGHVRSLHAEAAAQAFWGMFFAYAVSLGLLAESVNPELETGELVTHFVDIFVAGTLNRA
jgi:AcrR family transcriptional regulator